MEDSSCHEEERIEEKYCPPSRAEELITDDFPSQEDINPFPVQLIKVPTGNEKRHQVVSSAVKRDPRDKFDLGRKQDKVASVVVKLEPLDPLDMKMESNEVDSSAARSEPLDKFDMSTEQDKVASVVIKVEPLDAVDMTMEQNESTSYWQSEQNAGCSSNESTYILQDRVNQHEPNLSNVENDGKESRISDKKGKGKPKLTRMRRKLIVPMFEANISCREIARRLNVAPSTISRLRTRWLSEKTVDRKEGSGRQRITTEEEDEALVEFAKTNPFTTAAELRAAVDFRGSVRTVQKRLHDAGFRSKRDVEDVD